MIILHLYYRSMGKPFKGSDIMGVVDLGLDMM